MLSWTAYERQKLLAEESRKRFERARTNPDAFADTHELRQALLDFIADFANWDNSTVREYLDTARALTLAAHQALGGAPGTLPLVMDPFAGGGAIPLEALRIGADAFASDLNPIAVLLNKILLEYIPRYGERLIADVREWSEWVKREAEAELATFYPKEADSATPIAFLWARTIRCEGPGCGVEIPLVRNTQLTRGGKLWHLTFSEPRPLQLEIRVGSGSRPTSQPTVRGGSAICPRHGCGYTTAAVAVRSQLAARHGGGDDARLLAVYVERPSGRFFRDPTPQDIDGFSRAQAHVRQNELPSDLINPVRPYKNTRGLSAVTRIGITRFSDLYTSRQALAIQTLLDILCRLPEARSDDGLRLAVVAVLNCAISRFIFQNCSLSRWNAARSTIEGAFGKQALQVVWDFAESNPLSDGPANWSGAVEWIVKVIEANLCVARSGIAVKARAQDRTLPTDSVDALITDPPYFAAIPYSDLSNVFFVWERAIFKERFPELYSSGLVPQDDEIVVTNANVAANGEPKDSAFFRQQMVQALDSARNAVRPGGIGVIVFAESETSSWEAMLGAVIESNWQVCGSWPIDTELQSRTQAADSASLQSSIHIVCRPRENSDGSVRSEEVGDWRDVLQELPRRMHEWMSRLAAEGVVGADAIFACLGPALEIYSRYSRVEKASGEIGSLKEYLEQVWAAVAKEALALVFAGVDTTGFEPDARLTAMWLWTMNSGASQARETQTSDDEQSEAEPSGNGKKKKVGGFTLEYDAARKIAQGLGANLEALDHVAEVLGDKARLLSVAERARYLFGKEESAISGRSSPKKPRQSDFFAELKAAEQLADSMIGGVAPGKGRTTLDRVHQSMILFAAGRSEALKRFLIDDGVGRDPSFWHLAQALSALYPPATDEKRWVDGVLARKKGLGF